MCDMGAGGHALHVLLHAVLYVALYSGGPGVRAPLLEVLELRVL